MPACVRTWHDRICSDRRSYSRRTRIRSRGPAKIGIIAFQPAVFGTNEGQRDSAQLRQKFDPKQAQLKALNDEIDSLTTALKSQGDKLSDAERAARQRTIEEKQKTLQRNVEDAQNEAQAEMGTMYQTLAQKVYKVLQTYAQQNGYTMIVDISTEKSPILWASQATDVTQAVVQAYNAKSGVPAQPGAGAAPAATRPAERGGHSSASLNHAQARNADNT